MLGGLNSVRRENHHYKYAHCTDINDLKTVNLNYTSDLTFEGEWNFSLEKLKIDITKHNNNIWYNAQSEAPFYGSPVKKISTHFPSITNGAFLFYGCKSLEEIECDFSHFTDVMCMFRDSGIKKISENFNPNTRDFRGLFMGVSALYKINENKQPVIPFHPVLNEVIDGTRMFDLSTCTQANWSVQEILDERYTLDNLVIGDCMFHNGWDYATTGLGGDIVLNLVSLENGSNMFKGNWIKSFSSPLPKLKNGNEMFSSNSARRLREFNSELPSLENGSNMFHYSTLDKNSIIRIVNSIPQYDDGSHPLTLGISNDYFFDKEIPSYISIAEDKGWTLTVEWNGNPTKEEVINPEKIDKLEMDDIILPYGYARCEYLESDSNNQFIDTNIIPTNDVGAWIIAKRITESVDGYAMAVRTNSNFYYPPVLRLNGNHHGWGTTTQYTDITSQNTIFESYINYPINGTIAKEAVVINNMGTSITKTLSTSLPTISHSLYIFGRNYNGKLENPWNGRIYRVKISEGDQIIRDFIPALDPDGKPCMYEMIEGKPYYNAATSGDDFLYKVYEDYVVQEFILPSLNIEEGNVYTPDASSWNEIATAKLAEAEEKIVRVENCIAYNE